ncbi:MAG: hypothetical protein N3A57_06275 [Negativicutes bacterium]|nr:hypothetical protein [Negativicutes bacterium]
MKIDHEKIRQFMDEIRQMKQNEERVIAHEAAHVAAGGQYAGGPSYGYTRGPDGKSYITSGEVPIDVSEEDTPDKTIAKMAVVQKAALAPADPSPADLAIAAQAALIAAINRGKLAAQSNPAATGDSEHDEQPKPPVTGVSAVGGSYVDRQSPKTEVMPTTGGNDRLTGVAGVDAAGVRPPGNTKKQPT